MLLIDRKGVKDNKSANKQNAAKPNICRLPTSDLMSRMSDFMPFLSGEKSAPVPEALNNGSKGAVEFVPMSDSDSDSSDSDSDSCSEEESSDDGQMDESGPCVEMRLAVVPDNDSDSDEENAPGAHQLGEVTELNIRLPGQTDKTKSPVIEEMN